MWTAEDRAVAHSGLFPHQWTFLLALTWFPKAQAGSKDSGVPCSFSWNFHSNAVGPANPSWGSSLQLHLDSCSEFLLNRICSQPKPFSSSWSWLMLQFSVLSRNPTFCHNLAWTPRPALSYPESCRARSPEAQLWSQQPESTASCTGSSLLTFPHGTDTWFCLL